MSAVSIAVLLLTLGLAAANAANDVSKGVATLAGAGVARYRTAILWGTGSTFVGAIASAAFAERILFSRGIVAGPPAPVFALAVLVGATAWVCFATATRLPVSTTHAILGALIGAGLELSPRRWFRANLTTALLVGAGANLGLPMSTTHVATGAIPGLARRDLSRLIRQTLRDFGIAWTLTPCAAGLVSMVVFGLLS